MEYAVSAYFLKLLWLPFFETIRLHSVFVDIHLKCSIVIVDIAVNQEYIRVEYLNRRGIIIAKLDNNANPVLSRGARDPLVISFTRS